MCENLLLYSAENYLKLLKSVKHKLAIYKAKWRNSWLNFNGQFELWEIGALCGRIKKFENYSTPAVLVKAIFLLSLAEITTFILKIT